MTDTRCCWYEDPFEEPPTGRCEQEGTGRIDGRAFCGPHSRSVIERNNARPRPFTLTVTKL